MRRHPARTSLAVGLVVFGVVSAAFGPSGWFACDRRAPSAPAAGELDGQGDARAPRAILSRVWFDRYPERSRDKVRLWIWLAGGIGLTEHGSFFDARYEIFEFERQADKVSMVFLQDRAKAETKFKVEACDELPPFDLCLTLDASPRGPKKLYGFGDDEDLAEHVPWGPAFQRVARERAASVER